MTKTPWPRVGAGVILVTAILTPAALIGCEKEGPAERAGKNVDRNVEKAGDKVKEAGDKIKDSTNR